MAVINLVVQKLATGVHRAFWEQMSENDTAEPISDYEGGPTRADKCVQVTGSFGSGDVSIEGSNDGVTYHVLKDGFGTALTFSAAGIAQIMENPRYLRPKTPTGSAVDVDITLISRSDARS